MKNYEEIKKNLSKGWNTWNNRSVLSHVLLPEGLCINLCFKQHNWIDEKYLKHSLIGRWQKGSEVVKPYLHTCDGSYTELEIKWENVHAKVQSAHIDNDLVILVTPLNEFDGKAPSKLIIESGILWNQPAKNIEIFTTIEKEDEDPFVDCLTPYFSVFFTKETGVSTGKKRTAEEIKKIIEDKKENVLAEIRSKYKDLSDTYIAIQSVLAWNTIYDPKGKRVISTVGRLWNEEYGGYCLFGWDNFFLSYMLSIDNKELSFSNIIEHLKSANEEGFISNDYRGNGTRSWDRSQPPVGSIMVKEIYEKYPEKWFLEMTYEPLLKWNEWYFENRMNQGLLSYGSHVAEKNLYNEPHIATLRTARFESGMDDSPMYTESVFNSDKNVLELQDVGLNSLYLADCEALIEIAKILGKDFSEIEKRKLTILSKFQSLWSDEYKMYLN
ncbi:MAG: hypothetical protein KAH33_00705, partial [Candidatus Delongbacteria bacterium]|nr:hypothetical protein [Candidatus Delongbacteria bacterium]